MRKFAFEMMFSEDRSTNDYVDPAVDDLSVQGIDCLIRTYNFVKDSKVEDFTTVDRASETRSCKGYQR